MNTKKYNEFAAFWQQMVSITKVAFASKSVTATPNFKQAYKHNTGIDFDDRDNKDVPIAIEPMCSKCRTAAVGCYIFMSSGCVYEGIIRTKMNQGKGIIHLVWFVAKDATQRPIIPMDAAVIKADNEEVDNMKQE